MSNGGEMWGSESLSRADFTWGGLIRGGWNGQSRARRFLLLPPHGGCIPTGGRTRSSAASFQPSIFNINHQYVML